MLKLSILGNVMLNAAVRTTAAAPAFLFTPQVERETAPIWERVSARVTPLEWRLHAPLIAEINRLKKERNAVILAHNYMTPEIFHGVGDYVGDSLGLAREAQRAEADIIVQAGVKFMAETSKVLSPDKRVLIPDLHAGCSLASSITAADVRLMRQRYPSAPVVAYVNTTADVKAEVDVCCTSANAVQVVEWAAREWGSDRVLLIPDEFLARNVARQTSVKIVAWQGRCEVHERFTAADILELRAALSQRRGAGPPRMPHRGDRGLPLHGLDRRHDRLCGQEQTQAGGADHRMLHGRQRSLVKRRKRSSSVRATSARI